MFKLSRLTDYGIVVLTHFVRRGKSSISSAKDVSESTNIPLPTVSKVLKILARKGLLNSQRGASGGYSLAKNPDDVSIADILRTFDGPIALTECSSIPNTCDQELTCPVGGHWTTISRTVEEALDRLALSRLARPKFKLASLDDGAIK